MCYGNVPTYHCGRNMNCAGMCVSAGGGFSVMWIAPFDSVVISLKAVIKLSCGGILCGSAGWLCKVRLRSSSTLYCAGGMSVACIVRGSYR